MGSPRRSTKRTFTQAFDTFKIIHSHVSSTNDFFGKSFGNQVIFCAPNVRDYNQLLTRFHGRINGEFRCGSYKAWKTKEWPLVCALSVDSVAPRIKGNKSFKEESYGDAVSALKSFLKKKYQHQSKPEATSFYVLDAVFAKNKKELTMVDVITKALSDISFSTDAQFFVCRGKSSVKEINGDLFSSRQSLAHCVSEDLAMGAGIAKIFKHQFKNVQYLRQQRIGVGKVAILPVDSRFIYYLVTKKRHFDKPTYANVRYSLVEMRNHALEKQVSQISMPAIGCGLDKLNWDRMKLIIKEVFLHTDIDITIYLL